MEDLNTAINRLKSCMGGLRDTRFWAAPIFRPNTNDLSEASKYKNKLIDIAESLFDVSEENLETFEMPKLGTWYESMDELEEKLADDAERKEFANFLDAIQNVLGVIKSNQS